MRKHLRKLGPPTQLQNFINFLNRIPIEFGQNFGQKIYFDNKKSSKDFFCCFIRESKAKWDILKTSTLQTLSNNNGLARLRFILSD